jgi:lipoate-protein ligase A
VRVWRYDRAAVVLGRGQRSDAALEARARRLGLEVHGRATGGGAVLAGPWMIGATVVLPPGHRRAIPDLRASYRWLGEAHGRWLERLGVRVELVDKPVDRGLGWACYGGSSYGELDAGGAKLVGLAQARRRTGALFSAGTLVSRVPWELLVDVMGRALAEAHALARATTSVAAIAGAAPLDELAVALLAEVVAAL